MIFSDPFLKLIPHQNPEPLYSTLISTQDLAANLSDSNLVIVDCRFSLSDVNDGRIAYTESHIPGARYAHLDEDLSGEIIPGKTGRHPLPPIAQFVEKLGAWGIDKTKQVVMYDDMGSPFAARMWSMLKWLGHEAAAVLDGGWVKWLAENLPTEKELPEILPLTFVPKPNPTFIVDANAVEAATQNAEICLIDARAEARYAGREEPLDPVAGHIPSAISFPWMENLDENKCFLPPQRLKERFEKIDTGKSIVYCGSGVTAAHNLLAIAHAGLPLPQLYAGSWSEWVTSPSRPISTE